MVPELVGNPFSEREGHHSLGKARRKEEIDFIVGHIWRDIEINES